MISDINTHDYYYQFIRNCKTDLSKYTDKLNSIVEERNLLKIVNIYLELNRYYFII